MGQSPPLALRGAPQPESSANLSPFHEPSFLSSSLQSYLCRSLKAGGPISYPSPTRGNHAGRYGGLRDCVSPLPPPPQPPASLGGPQHEACDHVPLLRLESCPGAQPPDKMGCVALSSPGDSF